MFFQRLRAFSKLNLSVIEMLFTDGMGDFGDFGSKGGGSFGILPKNRSKYFRAGRLFPIGIHDLKSVMADSNFFGITK